MQEALLAALASQSAHHESQLEAKLAERDAEALEALRLLDARHRAAAVANRNSNDSQNQNQSGAFSIVGMPDAASTSEVGEKAGALDSGGGGGGGGDGGGGDESRVGDGGDGGSGSIRSKRHRQRRQTPMVSTSASSLQNGARQDGGGEEDGGEVAASSRRSAPPASSKKKKKNADVRRLRSRSRSRRASDPAAGAGTGAVIQTTRSASAAASATAAVAAVAARDAALREAKEESDRLGEVVSSPGGSEQSWPSPLPTMTGLVIGGGGGTTGGGYGSPYRRYIGVGGGGSSPDSTASGRLALSVAGDSHLETTPTGRAPVWTVGSGDAVVPAVGNGAGGAGTPSTSFQTRASDGSLAGVRGVGGRDWRVAARSDAGAGPRSGSSAGGGVVVESSGREGLTVTEERYKGELEVLRSRVREVEGMMESRLEDRARVYRRKLRAAVAECRTSRVRETGSVKFIL